MLPTSVHQVFREAGTERAAQARAAADEAEDTLGLAGVVDVVGERPELADEQNAEDLTEQIQPRRCRFRAGLEQRPEERPAGRRCRPASPAPRRGVGRRRIACVY
jgi:hypothetical protein